MKRLLFVFALAATLCACGEKDNSLKIGTYNIRLINGGDRSAGNGWEQRSPYLLALLRYEAPDIFGAQEVRPEQIPDMTEALPEYDWVGVGRDDGADKGEFVPVFWLRERFEALDKGWFWLSESPDVPGKGWDAACNRVCTWVHLKDRKSGKKIWFFNLHMDHVGVVAREESAKLIVSKIEQMCHDDEVVFVTGDYNVDQNDSIFNIFEESSVLTDSYAKAADRFIPNGTYNAFDVGRYTELRIDHIFVSPAVDVEFFAVRTDMYWSENEDGSFTPRTPSDHYPVFIKARLD